MSDARAHALLGALIGHYYHNVISAYFPLQLDNRFLFKLRIEFGVGQVEVFNLPL